MDQTPFFLCIVDEIYRKVQNWKNKFPRVSAYYAVKCNPDPLITRILAKLGCGFDCASQIEIDQILKLGTPADRIIYANPVKQHSSLRHAFQVGVNYMTFDNDLELEKIKETHSNAKCVLRIKTDDSKAYLKLSEKFGSDMNRALSLLDKARKLDIDVVGVSFHAGCGQTSGKVFADAIQNARELFDYSEKKLGVKMNLLDIGGGFYGPWHNQISFDKIATEINEALDAYFPIDSFPNLKLIAEPGKYFACTPYMLCANVVGKNVMEIDKVDEQDIEHKISGRDYDDERENKDEQAILIYQNDKKIDYYLNVGIFGPLKYYFPNDGYPLLVSSVLDDCENENGSNSTELKGYKSTVWGPTCTNMDFIFKPCLMPEVHVKDWIIFKNVGAYTISCASNFNGFPIPKVVYLTFDPLYKDLLQEAEIEVLTNDEDDLNVQVEKLVDFIQRD